MTPQELASEVDPGAAALAGAGFVALGVPLAILAVRLCRRLWPWSERARPVSWGLFELVPAVLVFLLATMLGVESLAALHPDHASALRSGDLPTPLLPQVLGVQALSLSAVGALAILWSRRGAGPASLGLRRGANLRAVAVGAVAWTLCLPLVLGISAMWPWLLERMGEPYVPQQWAGIVELGGVALAVAAVLAAFVVPFLEELVFRGFLQPLLVRWLGTVGGIGTTAAVFASLHPGAFLPILALALVLGLVQQRTQRLSAAWAAHALNNGFTLALLSA